MAGEKKKFFNFYFDQHFVLVFFIPQNQMLFFVTLTFYLFFLELFQPIKW